MTTAAGIRAERILYRPFGEATKTTSDLTTTPESKGYIGERFDADAGLQYLNARYYDPKLGLFHSAGLVGGDAGWGGGEPIFVCGE